MQKIYVDEKRKRRVNRGELPAWYIEDDHPAIVSRKLWEEANAVIRRRMEGSSNENNMHLNVVVFYDGKTYMLEAGYVGKAPRKYTVTLLENPFGYEILSDKTAGITYYAGTDEDIVIPSVINGYIITEVCNRAFSNNKTIRSCKIPEGVVSIGADAFVSCENLESVTVPSTLKSIGFQGFRSCVKLKDIDISSVSELGDEAFNGCDLTGIKLSEELERIGRSAFCGNRNMKSIDIPASVKEIDEWAFTSCGLTEVRFLGNAVTYIAEDAFHMNSIRSFRVPASVTTLELSALSYNPLESWVVDKNNKAYSSADGVLFNKDGTELIQYPYCRTGSSYRIPDGVQVVKSFAFEKAQELEEIVIPASVKTLEYYALNTAEDDTSELTTNVKYRFLGGAPEIARFTFQIPSSVEFYNGSCDVYYPVSEISWKQYTSLEDDERFLGVIWHACGDLSKDAEIKIETQYYTGKAISPDPVVTAGGMKLKKNTDYTVSYSNNINVGTATAVITGKGTFTGTVRKTFMIKKPSVTNAAVTGITNKIYNGKEQIQDPAVKIGGRTLKNGTDYTLSYSDNISIGKAMITITGTGNYIGSVNREYSILPGKTARGDMFNLANNVKVIWKEVPGAKYYKVYREGLTNPYESMSEPVIVTSGLVGWDKQPGLINNHAYRYKIVASTTGKDRSGNNDPSGDSPLSYTKVMYRLKTVVIRSVKNTAPGKVTVRYDMTTCGDSYVLQYSERQDMVGAKTKVVQGFYNTSYVIGGLEKGKTYYISIRVRKKEDGINYYTTFGVPKKITITQ